MTRVFDADWMWREAVLALERAEQHHRRFFALVGTPKYESAWEPPVDIFETDTDIWIVVALPGVPAENVTLRVEAAELVVQTERPLRAGLDAVRIRRLEIPYGVFERRIPLPPGRYALRERQMVDGCLELHLTRE
ncbi:MAG TPA: Hsp20/alpha crystallin family protein [Steroidobacteraceae bacterium]|nr:Hsp20/alpha crystallin family protein [Steroidobacteraceae bacterium]